MTVTNNVDIIVITPWTAGHLKMEQKSLGDARGAGRAGAGMRAFRRAEASSVTTGRNSRKVEN